MNQNSWVSGLELKPVGFVAGIETGGIHDLNWNRYVSRFEMKLMGFKAGNDGNHRRNTCIYIKHATYRCWPCSLWKQFLKRNFGFFNRKPFLLHRFGWMFECCSCAIVPVHCAYSMKSYLLLNGVLYRHNELKLYIFF